MSPNRYNALPESYALVQTSMGEPATIPGIYTGREFCDPSMIFLDENGLLHTSQSFLHPLSDLTEITLSEDSPFLVVLDALRILSSPAPFNHEARKILVANCGRAFIATLLYDEGEDTSIEEMRAVALRLQHTFDATSRAIAELPEAEPEEIPRGEIPTSFTTVTEELRKAMELSNVPLHIWSTFQNGALLSHPVVIHPVLDEAVDYLRHSVFTICESIWNLNTREAAFTQVCRAFDVVNTSLFLNPQDLAEKASALLLIIKEFWCLYLRHPSLSHKYHWVAITLIGPYLLSALKELCQYLAESVELITGVPFDLEFSTVEEAIAQDLHTIEICWKGNIATANKEKCRNPRTCRALADVGEWAFIEVNTYKDKRGATFAIQEAWRLAQMTVPGSYEYLALMHTMYELRKCMYASLEEWEFIYSEVALGDVLGEGGFATVRVCEWFGGKAAVKTFRPNPLPSKQGATALTKEDMGTYLHRRELEIWYRLSHPHVLPFLGACLTRATPMILTPLSTNGSARSYRSRHPEANWLQILYGVTSGVDFLHTEAKIVHGDLKGANILLNSEATPQIADFGLAKMTENIYGHRESTGGTAQWMAPELLDGSGHLTYASDIYALGMTLYELWYNKDPFELLEPDLVKEMVLEEQLRPERDSSPASPEELWSTIEGCWTTDAGSRLSSSAVTHQLQVFAGDPAVVTEEVMIDGGLQVGPLPGNEDDAIEEEPHSIENLPCTHLHELGKRSLFIFVTYSDISLPAVFPERAPFPFISSGHLVSFSVETQMATHMYGAASGVVHLKTHPSAIPKNSTTLHPVQRISFRIQSDTDFFAMTEKELDIPGPCRFEAVILRQSAEDETHWVELSEGRTTLHDAELFCDSTVAHQVELDSTSPIASHALPGDSIGLKVLVDHGYRCRVDYAEIEMHVRMDSETPIR
ncbi:hypothetical protein FRC04_010249 [Tulasnella sp. 424]|nr:hypothetical protein FRC04_010249 [Tulasnella sp. 424]KAG8972099.1 hypothetical protein FRC05_010391 [Tulasnella sp. 425]